MDDKNSTLGLQNVGECLLKMSSRNEPPSWSSAAALPGEWPTAFLHLRIPVGPRNAR